MASATARPGRHARQGSGLVVFAAVLLLVVGFFNLIDGIVAIARSPDVVALWGLCAYGSRENLAS
jgi:hypothetical protein